MTATDLHIPGRKLACSVNRAGRITWLCDECGQPIKPETGYLTVDSGQATRQRQDAEERSHQRKVDARANGQRFVVVNMAEMMTWPECVEWEALHSECDQYPERDDYWFGVERADRLAKLLDWSAHLMGKVWLEETNWDDLLRTVAAAAGGADA
jgi:hypothetical protein